MKKKLIAGNWKMNGSLAANEALVKALLVGLGTPACQLALCVPSIYLGQMQALLAGSAIDLGAQDMSAHEVGAFTGEISAAMLKEFGVRYCLVGHSERRQYHFETDVLQRLAKRRHPKRRCIFGFAHHLLKGRAEALNHIDRRRQHSALHTALNAVTANVL